MENLESIEQSTAIVEVKKETVKIVEVANSVAIANDEDANKTSVLIQSIAKMKKSLNSQRLFFTKPLNDQMKKINELFKQMSSPLVEADEIVRVKVLAYRKEQQKIADEQERLLEIARKKRQAKIDKIAEEKGVEAPKLEVTKVEASAPMQGATTRKSWTYKVVDQAKIPREYLQIDVVAVREAIRNGVRAVDGLEIFEEETLVASRG